jgi:hypothetical protein
VIELDGTGRTVQGGKVKAKLGPYRQMAKEIDFGVEKGPSPNGEYG